MTDKRKKAPTLRQVMQSLIRKAIGHVAKDMQEKAAKHQ